MSEIMTVLGPVSADKLGFTSMHEHILNNGNVLHERERHLIPDNISVNPDETVSLHNVGLLRRTFFLTWDAVNIDDEATMLEEVSDFKKSGGSAMLDMSVPGLRRDILSVARISRESGVHIITSTGLYTEDSWPSQFKGMTIEEYMKHMHGEIENGIDNTHIKAGHIKVGVLELSDQQEKVIRAASRVADQTGFSLTIHPGFTADSDGNVIAEILKTETVRLDRVIIAHIQNFLVERNIKKLVSNPDSWYLNLDYACKLLDQGFNLSIDSFGQIYDRELAGTVQPTDWQRMGALVSLIKLGYASQLIVGTDTFLKFSLRRFGGEGYCRLTKYVIPMLKEMGISEDDINRITVENPKRLLSR